MAHSEETLPPEPASQLGEGEENDIQSANTGQAGADSEIDDSDDSNSEASVVQPILTSGQAVFLMVVGTLGLALAVAVIWRLQAGAGDTPADHFRKGWQAFVDKNDVELEKRCRRLLAMKRYKSHAEVLHAALYIREKRYRDALNICQQWGSQQEDTRSAAMTIAALGMLKVGTRNESLSLFVQAAIQDPDNLIAHRNAGSMFYDLGAMDLSIRHLSEVSRLAPADARPHRLMGLINKDFGRYQSAVVDYEECQKRNPDHARKEVLLEMAQCKLKLKRFQDAIETVDKLRLDFLLKGKLPPAKALSPTDRLMLVDSMVVKSDSLHSLNKTQDGLVEIDLALQYAPNHLEALLHKTNLLLAQDKAKEALALCLRAVERHPKSEVARYTIAQLYAQLGDDTNAKKQMTAFQQLKTTRTRFVEANIQAIKEPSNVDIRYELALLAADLDRPQLAITWLKAVLSLSPSHDLAKKKIELLNARLAKEMPQRSKETPLIKASEGAKGGTKKKKGNFPAKQNLKGKK